MGWGTWQWREDRGKAYRTTCQGKKSKPRISVRGWSSGLLPASRFSDAKERNLVTRGKVAVELTGTGLGEDARRRPVCRALG